MMKYFLFFQLFTLREALCSVCHRLYSTNQDDGMLLLRKAVDSVGAFSGTGDASVCRQSFLLSDSNTGSTRKWRNPKLERMENTTAVVKITETAAAGPRRTDFIMLGGGG
jgi:hypothetical protein